MQHDDISFEKSTGMADVAPFNGDLECGPKQQFISLQGFQRQLSGHINTFIRMQDRVSTTNEVRTNLDALNRGLATRTGQVTGQSTLVVEFHSAKGSFPRLV
jgi:hypothetical protein